MINARQVIDCVPAAIKYALLTVGAPCVTFEGVSVQVQHQGAFGGLKPRSCHSWCQRSAPQANIIRAVLSRAIHASESDGGGVA